MVCVPSLVACARIIERDAAAAEASHEGVRTLAVSARPMGPF